MIGKIKTVLKGGLYYIYGHIVSLSRYDRKYLQGRWFEGKLDGICSIGWKWVAADAYASRKLHINEASRFPVAAGNIVVHPENIEFHPDDLNNFQSIGCYFQAIGKIKIGKGTFIGPNVGLITANHDSADLNRHLPPEDIVIGERCWIGMNSVILPGVRLGDDTIVGAGSVVTKSFEDGNVIIAGNPAGIIRKTK